MRGWLGATLVILTGCGGDDDCCTIDAAVDMAPAVDAPMLPATHHHYVIDRLLVPTTNTQAREFGLELNGDATVDNQLGMVMSTLAGMGFPIQAENTRLIDTGAAIMLPELGTDDLANETTATFTIYQGANAVPAPCLSAQDTVCRQHLAGTGAFSIKAGAPVDPPLLGSITGGVLAAGPGHLTIQLVFVGQTPIMMTLLGARAELTSTATTQTGKIGGAVSKTDIDTKILPAMRDSFAQAVAQDCTMLTSPPSCGCAQDTTGKTLLGLFDTSPKDCMISLAEVQNNSLLVSLLSPDVMVEGMQALSLGLSVHAVGATYTPP